MATITRIKAAPGIMVSVGRYTLIATYQNVDLELLSDDTILGMQEEYEAERIIFEDYNAFREFYDLLKNGSGSGTITEGAATEAHQAAIIIKLNELLTELYAKASAGEAQLVQLPASAANVTKQDEIIAQLAGLLTELAKKADLNEIQPVSVVPGAASTTVTVAASLDADTNIIPAGLLSVTIINNGTSPGAMTVSTANGSAALNPGEAVTFDAENPNSLLDGITVTGGFAITGRMFGTRYVPVVIGGV